MTAIIKDGLLVGEMYLASLLHPFAFPPEDYAPAGEAAHEPAALSSTLSAAVGSALHARTPPELILAADDDDAGGAHSSGRVTSCGGALHEALLMPLALPFGELEQAGGVSRLLSPSALGMVRGSEDERRFDRSPPQPPRPHAQGLISRLNSP